MQEERQTVVFHDSRNPFYRSPVGAVATQSTVVLRLAAAAPLGRIWVRQWQDGSGETLQAMEPCDLMAPDNPAMDANRPVVYQAILTVPAEPSLIWYYFVLQQDGYQWFYGNQPDGLGGVGLAAAEPPLSFQITVHRPQTQVPNWFRDAVVYQIYVERFYNGHEDGLVHHAPPGSLVHAHWDDAPVYAQAVGSGVMLAYDYFGGNLAGVRKKLGYLKELGVNAIYFNPVFSSPSNHKYDTADYKTIDPMYGDNREFADLLATAGEMGIRVVLDGVFSHTGADSIYFNQEGRYPGLGAYQSPESPYYSWYRFTQYPDEYESWWGIGTMPNVYELDPSYQDYIINDKHSVIRQWMKMGVKGWRLDVADELPPAFIGQLRKVMKETDPESVLIGEVWEDASHKLAYGEMRMYFGGDELDGVMNYPLRKIILDYLLGYQDSGQVDRCIRSLHENYPRDNFYCNLNVMGSHDVPRLLTILGGAPDPDNIARREQARYRLPPEQKKLGVARMKLAVLWQMAFPGAPCVYYGDEAGVEGFKDPLNRRTFPWGKENKELTEWYKQLIHLRNRYAVLRTGSWQPLLAEGDVYGFLRSIDGGRDEFGGISPDCRAWVLMNRSRSETRQVTLDLSAWTGGALQDLLNPGTTLKADGRGRLKLSLPPLSGRLLLAEADDGRDYPGRDAGVLLHLTSLPSAYGCGDLGAEARRFVDFLAAAGQHWWQFLPLNPPGMGDSPYQCLSAFAGNPLLICPEGLAADGLLTEKELADFRDYSGLTSKLKSGRSGTRGDGRKVHFDRVKTVKETLLRQAFARFQAGNDTGGRDYLRFLEEHAYWLDDYVLYMALREQFQGQAWNEWPADIARRQPDALTAYRRQLAAETEYHAFVQFVFFRQWQELRAYARQQGVGLFGDLPLFVAHDSADVWSHPELFALDKTGRPEKVAGVPPDYFSATGQLWGNPQYRWKKMAADDYLWWRERLRTLFGLVDRVRIDHFRGFESYWEIPGDAETAVNGSWVPGPGQRFFEVLRRHLGELDLVAEDLGIITEEVNRLKDTLGLPGMRVLQFSFGGGKPDFPYNCPLNTIAYTGTHDNDTLRGWYRDQVQGNAQLADAIRRDLDQVTDTAEPDLIWRLVELVYTSRAATAMVPLQDLLGLGNEARMNLPGTVGANWDWRLPDMTALDDSLAAKLRKLSRKHQRLAAKRKK
ncbi:MAG TPA: bifunctional glycogen debranching protein GlgX/4-alpha-glucanotransferase [Patescibacteria group bacterium]|nr:bifunctional glycogen debranching protein GlgX/4-alpha-glucanotransferase [Patescibacteria group bacterium]